jgi:ABC-2 type transport system permease protein
MTTTQPRAAHADRARVEAPAPPPPAQGVATIVRREILTRTSNRTILTATLALAAIAGLGAGIGGWFLVDATREAGTVVLDTRILFATAMISALLAAMVYSSSSLASGVVEEKSSRIVEILLTKIGVAPLLAGKMIGVGLVTLAQLLVIGGAVVAGFSVVGGWSVLEVELGPSLVWFLVWFFQGYVLFALLSTLLASTVSRQEDLGTAAMPLSVVQMALLIIALYVVPANLDETWVQARPLVRPALLLLPDADALRARLGRHPRDGHRRRHRGGHRAAAVPGGRPRLPQQRAPHRLPHLAPRLPQGRRRLLKPGTTPAPPRTTDRKDTTMTTSRTASARPSPLKKLLINTALLIGGAGGAYLVVTYLF